jgi:glycosyl hydrolase family 26
MSQTTSDEELYSPDVAGDDRSKPRRSRRPPRPRRRLLRLILVVLLALALVVTAVVLSDYRLIGLPTGPSTTVRLPPTNTGRPSLERARAVLGTPPSKGTWFSGIWAGGAPASTDRVQSFGAWRGTVVDSATLYPQAYTWQDIHDSDWHINTYQGFDGVLVYGLPMLPDSRDGDFASIVAGRHDWVYEQVARDLRDAGRARSVVVRIGWEANGDWFPWEATARTARGYIAAYRHIVAVLRRVLPDVVIDFDIACGTPLRGQQDRLDALNLLYPGDDAVDVVGCDTYDWYDTRVFDDASWEAAVRPHNRVGVGDVADFARRHGKGLSIPEWGLASTTEGGSGDNPFYLERMRSFFETNADILVLEGYFSEPATSIANSLWDPDQNPRSAEVYAKLW